jgi:hypothetical protein
MADLAENTALAAQADAPAAAGEPAQTDMAAAPAAIAAVPAIPAAAVSTPLPAPLAPSPDWLGRNLYVRRLPPVNAATGEMPSESHVLALFSRFGEVEHIKVVRDRNLGVPVGIALVLFKDPHAARLALAAINASNTGAVANMWLPKGVIYAGAGAI